jgi:hypothetical protein
VRVTAVASLRHLGRLANEVIPVVIRHLTNSWARVETAATPDAVETRDDSRLQQLKWGEGYFRVNALMSLRQLIANARISFRPFFHC